MSLLPPEVQECLSVLRKASDEEIALRTANEMPQDLIPHAYINSLTGPERIFCLRASLICFYATSKTMAPREMQLRTLLAEVFHGKDVMVAAGTGSGKTLPIALAILMQDPSEHKVTITISPLKRLQATQAHDFIHRYGIMTVVVNEGTPRSDEWWNGNIFGSGKKAANKNLDQTAQNVITTVEQLFRSPEGHFTRLGHAIRTNMQFKRRVTRIPIDEAHCIVTAGMPHYGLKAFRPAWGKLDQLKVTLPRSVRWLAFSATLPPHVRSVVKSKVLNSDHITVEVTSNRPNTLYTTHKVVKSIQHLPNYRCFLQEPFNMAKQPHVLIFADDKTLCQDIALYLRSCLPLEYQARGIVRHYHSMMSERYLQQAHTAFTTPDGACRILVATSGQSVGVDFPNVKIVCTVGVPTNIIDVLQRAGRALRNSTEQAIFLVFYESWAMDIDEKAFTTGDLADPDRPRSELKLRSNIRERVSLSGARLVQTKECLRKFFAGYLEDQSPEALDYVTGGICCDRCGSPTFSLQSLLPGLVLQHAGDLDMPVVDTQVEIRKRKATETNRLVKDRISLEELLISHVIEKLEEHPLAFVLQPYHILSDAKRLKLVKLKPHTVRTSTEVTDIIEETEEWRTTWGESILRVIIDFDAGFPIKKRRTIRSIPSETQSTSTLTVLNNISNTPSITNVPGDGNPRPKPRPIRPKKK